MVLVQLLAVAVLLLLCLVLHAAYVIRAIHAAPPPQTPPRPLHLVIVLGSGGHTAEMIRLLTALDFSHYRPRLYLVSTGDAHGSRLANELEQHLGSPAEDYRVIEIPRARRVHQPLTTTPLTTLISLRACIYLFWSSRTRGDVVLMNGPGTCVPVCLAVLLAKICGRRAPRLVYVESLARTTKLSLTARLVRPLVDVMLVQWPALVRDNGGGWLARCEYKGWLV